MLHRTILAAAPALVLASVLAITGGAEAVVTTWTNPAGGSWVDPANWSNGVPTASDTAVLPSLDGDGYAVALPSGAQAKELRVGSADGGGAVQLSGGSLVVSTSISVGVGGEQGSLVLAGTSAQAASVAVGANGGTGSLVLAGSTSLVGNTIACGQAGVGTLEVESGALLVPALSLNLFADATLKLWAKPGASPSVLAGNVARGGHLVILATPELVLPTPAVLLLNSSGIMSGSFATVTGPIVEGYEVPVTVTIQWIAIAGVDPVVGMEIVFPNGPIYAGFDQPIDVVGVRYSGATTGLCLCCSCPGVEFASSNPEQVYVTAKTLHVGTAEATTLTATHVEDGVLLSTSVEIDPIAPPPVTYQPVATSATGEAANSQSLTLPGPAAWTPDGRFVVFASYATNLVEPDPEPDQPNIYLKDLATGAVEQIDVGAAFGPVSLLPTSVVDVTDDGRSVVFLRRAQGSPYDQVWLRDRWTGTTSLLTVGVDRLPANANCSFPRISPSGDRVVFVTKSTNLAVGVDGSHAQVLARTMPDGTFSVVSVGPDGQLANGSCDRPSLAADGSLVAFETAATNLVADNTGSWKIVLWDPKAGGFSRLDLDNAGLGANKSSAMADLSADGRYAVFTSQATNLGGDGDSNAYDVFVRDRVAGTTTFVSPFVAGEPGGLGYAWPTISGDGAYVAFIGYVYLQYSSGVELRRVNRETLAYDFVAVDPWGEVHQVWLTIPQLSPNGSRVLFGADEAGLVPFGASFASTFIRDFTPPLPADLNHDGHVNSADLAMLLGAWSTSGPGDIDGDGVVGAPDLGLLLGSWTG